MKYIYTIQGFEKADKELVTMYDVVQINLSADSVDDALNEAKKLIKKTYWRIASISENPHPLEDEMRMLQLEMSKKGLDALKGNK